MKRLNGTETSSFGTNGRINHDSSKFYNSKLYTELENNEIVDKIENSIPNNYINLINNTIDTSSYKDFCYTKISINTNDKSICEKIHNEMNCQFFKFLNMICRKFPL